MGEKSADAVVDILVGTGFYLVVFAIMVWFLNDAFGLVSILGVGVLISLLFISGIGYFLALWHKLIVVASGEEAKSA